MTKIELFAQEKMSITLNEVHTKYLKAWVNGLIIHPARIAGMNTAKQVFIAYVKDGLEEI